MLRIEGLTRYYGNFLALDGLSMHLEAGELHGFVGPNGAGKTTAMRILAALLPASAGTAEIDGVPITTRSRKARALVGYMPVFFGTYDGLKVWEYLDFYARCYGLGRPARLSRTEQLLNLVGLADRRKACVNTLSRGMKQRLCLARALIHGPKLLILYEPASGMDPRARAEMKTILRTLKGMGKPVLISSHILPELAKMCDSLTILDHGRLVFTGTADALSRRMNGDAPLDIRFLPGTGEEHLARAVAQMKENPAVAAITRQEPLLLRVHVSGQDEACAALQHALTASGALICDFHRAPLNLEKVFMEVTGHA